MKNDLYSAIRKWAVRNVNGTLAKQIRSDIDDAWANNNSKAKKRFEFLYRLGEFENLPNAVKSIDIEERTKSREMQSCWMCGTRHADSYRATCTTGEKRQHFIGRDCGQILAAYGLGSGVILSADEKAANLKQKQMQDDLENLVLNEGRPIPLLPTSGPVKETRSDFLGSNYAWLVNQELPGDVRRAVVELKDPYFKASRSELKLVMDYVANNRTFPTDLFKPVLDDLKKMEAEGLATGVAARLEEKMANGTMTPRDAEVILDGTDYRGYRIARNTVTLKNYGEPLAGLLNDVIPALTHDKPKWHDDHIRQMYVNNKVLNANDYRLAKTCLNRWTFGALESIEGGDKQRIRNIAVSLESIDGFKDKIEGLVVIQRKMQYAKDHTSTEEYAQIEKVRESILGLPEESRVKVFQDACNKAYELIKDPMRLLQSPAMTVEAFKDQYNTDVSRIIDVAGKVHAKGWLNDFKRKYVPHLKEHLAYGILRKEDAPRLVKAAEKMKGYVRA